MLNHSSHIDESQHPMMVKRIGRLLSPGPSFNLYYESAIKRTRLEKYIADQFLAAYQAKLHDFMPLLLATTCGDGFCAAAGIRPTHNHPLFLEQYLPISIETILSQLAGQTVYRENIAEIGNLAATQRGASQLLFLMLTAVLHHTHLEWVTFTATPQVKKSIERLGIPLYSLYDANPNLLDNAHKATWGSYYTHQPQVVAARLSEAMTALNKQKAYISFFSLYKNRINALASAINQKQLPHGKPCFAA